MASGNGELGTERPERRYTSSFDVARRAGVSRSAVSRTFTKGGSVSDKTRAKVLQAAEELGYSPSLIPRMMLTHQSALIALVIGAMDHPDYAEVVELFALAIQDMGSRVLLFAVKNDQYMDEIIPKILSYRVDGIISALAIKSTRAADSCAKLNIPVVLFNGKVRNSWVASVCCDNVSGGRDVASFFLDRGARRMGYIAGPAGNLSNEERFAGYAGRLLGSGITAIATASGDFRYPSGYRAALELMRRSEPPDAIFCANDLMAIGALEAIRAELGLRVPEDVMVAGFDDIPAGSWPSIELTTLRQDGPRMVAEALDVLTVMFKQGQHPDGFLRTVPSRLIERGSTRRGLGGPA